MYHIKFIGNYATKGKAYTADMPNGKLKALPKNKFKRAGFKFVGWSLKRNNKVFMDSFQLGDPKYKNGQKVKNLAKDGETIKLYACWKGTGVQAAIKWARLIARDNSFTYGKDDHKNWYHNRDRAHQVGCYFCGTTITGVKKAKKGSRWAKTYCCNSFVMAAFTHGANMFKKCGSGSTKPAYWLKLKGGTMFKKQGRNVRYKDLKPGALLLNGKHIILYCGKIKGKYIVVHAAREGWDKKSIRAEAKKGRIGINYIALKYTGK